MVTRTELRKIARARLKDAQVLFRGRRYDAAIYICGYAIEIALKARICRTLRWSGYPSTRSEFEQYRSFRTHDLEALLHLSGIEDRIRANFVAEWLAVTAWDPEARYQPAGSAKKEAAELMLESAKSLLSAI